MGRTSTQFFPKILWALPCLVILMITILSGCGGGTGGGASSPPPTLSLSVTPSTSTVNAGSSFYVTVTATATNAQTLPTITLGALPAGITTSAFFPMSVPAAGATINFNAAWSLAAGNDTISISGSASTATATASFGIQAIAAPPNGAFVNPNYHEIEVAPGGSQTIQVQLANNSTYSVSLGVEGLPLGVAASANPATIAPNQSSNITFTASASAAALQNWEITITGTPVGSAPPGPTLSMLLDVVSNSGVGWSNQTSYVSTHSTPLAAVFDRSHGMIYAANQAWNEIDVISDQTRAIVKKISIQDPRGMDLSVDGSTVWVTTGCQVMYGINTTTLQAQQYILPRYGVTSISAGSSWEGAEVFSLADGTLLLIFSPYTGSGSYESAIWDPVTNAFVQTANPALWGVIGRSGDGKHVFSIGLDESETSFTYDVLSKTYGNPISLSNFGYGAAAVSNGDGTIVAGVDVNGITLYDGNFHPIGSLPGDGGWGSSAADGSTYGGIIFSPDGTKIIEETESTAIPMIMTFDIASGQAVRLSPAMPVVPAEMTPPYYVPIPFAVDNSGMVLGIQSDGIAFDDATVNLNYSSMDIASPTFMGHMSAYGGPLAGGTTTGGFGNDFSIVPDVYYGNVKGTATLSDNSVSITSPPSISAGPVDVKMLFPDGMEVYDPLIFTYGTQVLGVVISGATPNGGVATQLSAWGLPIDPSHDSVTVGGHPASVTSTTTQYPPFSGEYAMFLSFTAPAGSPGWADLAVTTPNGTGTLPRGFFYAQGVTDYAMTDSATFVLFDKGRNQLYLSAGDHIDVFSLSSNSFTTPLQPPAVGTKKQFQGLALTPDGKYLLATDLTDFSLAVIDPDTPSDAYVVPVATGGASFGYQCSTGPLFVAADNLGNAYVVTGGVVGINCGVGGYKATVNLASKTSALMTAPGCDNIGPGGLAGYIGSPADGRLIAISSAGQYGAFQIYNPAASSCIPVAAPAQADSVSVAADGSVIAVVRAFVSPSGNITGRFATPGIFYPHSSGYFNYDPYGDGGALQNAKLNDAGSLYYWAYPNYVDIVDVQHGMSALRFGLTETVTNTVAPMAIDTSGRQIFLLTDKGLTVVDLGNAPLSIGHFSQTSASAGTQIEIRGSGFESGILATVGGVSASLLYVDSETINLTLPVASAGPEDLTLTNPDGTSYTLQNAITIQ